MAKNANAISRRKHASLGKFVAKEGIEEGRFSGFHFADRNKEKRLPDIGKQGMQRLQ